MPTMTTSIFGNAIARGSTMSLGYILGLAEDIPADHWHDKCMDGMNHPAFIYGHLAIYPNRVLGAFLDREDLVLFRAPSSLLQLAELAHRGELVPALHHQPGQHPGDVLACQVLT